MPWTETTRPDYDHRELRYASDLRDSEWAVIAPLMPKPNRIGRPRKTDLHEAVNVILYIAAAGRQCLDSQTKCTALEGWCTWFVNLRRT